VVSRNHTAYGIVIDTKTRLHIGKTGTRCPVTVVVVVAAVAVMEQAT
jgi:hypothetical protein